MQGPRFGGTPAFIISVYFLFFRITSADGNTSEVRRLRLKRVLKSAPIILGADNGFYRFPAVLVEPGIF